MTLLLLVIIYLIFISLGLPDGILGSAWPAIQQDLHQPLGLGGLIALVVTLMTIVSSLATSLLVRKLGIGVLLSSSVALTALALFGFSQAPSVAWIFIFAVPLGLGAGAIDSALNNYVASHYDAHHMNWLHAFWGVGATIGPIIFSTSLIHTGNWHSGYLNLGIIQVGIVIIMLLSLPLWNKVKKRKVADTPEDHTELSDIKFSLLLKEQIVRYTFVTFLFYNGVEVVVGLWLASYLVNIQSISIETASLWTAYYYGAITVGRLLTGFISFKVSSKQMIRTGLALALIGAVTLALNIHPLLSICGIFLIGIGFAPIYPGLIHLTPERFGIRKSAKIMSLQMVGGYIGASVIPPLVGLLSGVISLHVFAIITPLLLLLIILTTERLNKITAK
ncbi:MAG: transporter [Candidatus Saccharibacteria bacterium]|nr:transporter [Candidatus Saccharibacteria bacterium]